MDLGKKMKGMGLAGVMLAASAVGLGGSPVEASKVCGGGFHSHSSVQHAPGDYYRSGAEYRQTWSARKIYVSRYGGKSYGGWVGYGSSPC